MCRVSVIVPVYQVEAYLAKCLDSILAQTFTDFELILVDDGTRDDCPRIMTRYAAMDARIRCIHKENGGLSSARNAGLDIARGEYIAFVDSDDTVEPTMLADAVAAAQRTGTQLVIYNYRLVTEDGVSADERRDARHRSNGPGELFLSLLDALCARAGGVVPPVSAGYH